MTDRLMTQVQQDQLEALVDACGLDLVLGGLANICAEKAAHLDSNWQDHTSARYWLKAMNAIDTLACKPVIETVSG